MASRPKDPARAYLLTLRRQRATLDRLLDRRGVLALKRYYDKAQDDLEKRLRRMAVDVQGDVLSPLQAQQLLVEVHAAQRSIAVRLHSQWQPALEQAALEGVDETDRAITELESELGGGDLSLPLTEETVRRGIVDRRRSLFEDASRTTFRSLGERLTGGAKERLSISLAVGDTVGATIDRLRQEVDESWWQGERIIVTEAAKAYNAAHADSLEVVGRELRDMRKRWTELVDDSTGAPLDNRVGKDSLVLHGQVTEVGGVFVMPPDPRVSPRMWNQTYYSSPNRPNDRSVTMPWRPGWGVPGWEWKDGQRVEIGTP